MTAVVQSLDNRGTDECPFGYVYFTDGVRLSFAPGTSGLGNPLGLFPSKGWGQPKRDHYTAATVALTDKGWTS